MNMATHFDPTRTVPPLSGPETLSVTALSALIQSGRECRILDVRTPAEFEAAHLESSMLRPLNGLEAGEWARDAAGAPLYLMCQTGGRASKAASILSGAGVPCAVIEGGMEAWMAAGLPVIRGQSRVLPLMRQVQIAVGSIVLVGSALALWKDPLFVLIPLGMGAGLIFAGVTGFCGLAVLLGWMPWNRVTKQAAGKLGTPAATCCAPSVSNGR